jgi:hypothetical protein
MPELLTCKETPKSMAGCVTGFKSEWWPASRRNVGGFNRNRQLKILKGYPAPRDARSRVIAPSYLKGRCPAG